MQHTPTNTSNLGAAGSVIGNRIAASTTIHLAPIVSPSEISLAFSFVEELIVGTIHEFGIPFCNARGSALSCAHLQDAGQIFGTQTVVQTDLDIVPSAQEPRALFAGVRPVTPAELLQRFPLAVQSDFWPCPSGTVRGLANEEQPHSRTGAGLAKQTGLRISLLKSYKSHEMAIDDRAQTAHEGSSEASK